MKCSAAAACIVLALISSLALPSWGQETPEARVRRSVDRSLPYLEREGIAWIKKHDCLSCHHVPFMLWSHQEARQRGIAVDEKKLTEWTDWASKESVAQRVRVKLADSGLDALKGESMPAETLAKLAPLVKKSAVKEAGYLKEIEKVLSPAEFSAHKAALLKHASREKGDGGGLDTMGQLLLAGTTGAEGSAEFVASTRGRIADLQETNGSWKPGGQLPRMNRSEAEGTEITTGWIVLALSLAPEASSRENLERARAFLKNGAPGKTQEGGVVRLLLEKKFGEAERTKALLKELIGRQNPDGGWASLTGGTSDAFATGQALYALSLCGVTADDAAVQRARAYLTDTQDGDGSWAVPPLALTSPATKPERLTRLEPIYRYWGTAWATIGLARTLPEKSRP